MSYLFQVNIKMKDFPGKILMQNAIAKQWIKIYIINNGHQDDIMVILSFKMHV